MDALSDVLKAVHLTGAVFFDVHASEPWVAETPPGGSIVSTIFPQADHLISYHAVTRGTCWGCVVGETPIRLSAGDIIVRSAAKFSADKSSMSANGAISVG